jgi:DNA-binding MarR family transcriptional regulator
MTTAAGREAWRLIHDLMFKGASNARMAQACSVTGISPGMMKTLLHLRPGEGVPMRELADHWNVDASYVTSLTDSLEERGLVERRPHASDRRIKMVALTDKGVCARKEAAALFYQPPAGFRALTSAEQRQLRDLLRKVSAAAPELAAKQAATRHATSLLG